MKRKYNTIIEIDSEGFYLGYVPKLKGYYSQAKTIDELMNRMQEVIALFEEL